MTEQDPRATALDAVMEKTEHLLAGVRPEQLSEPTPCPDWTVQQLEDHLVGWARSFATREAGEESDEDPNAYHVDATAAAAEFEAARRTLIPNVARKLAEPAPPSNESGFPVSATTTMLISEYVLHGWDLAVATDQTIPYTEEDAEASLGLRELLTPEFRSQMFGPEVPAPEHPTKLQTLLAFSGRDAG